MFGAGEYWGTLGDTGARAGPDKDTNVVHFGLIPCQQICTSPASRLSRDPEKLVAVATVNSRYDKVKAHCLLSGI